jgi:putative ABC transport system ATP-binding protein
MIELSQINFKYKESDFQLQFNSMKAESKKAIALIGPSGCGKTTLMSLIAGILPSQTGSILIDNTEIHQLTDKQRRLFRIQNIGFVFQDFALLEYLNLYENILHTFRINSALTLDASVRKRANDIAEKVGISKRLKHYPGQTSVGEQQRCAIARALLNEPVVILADEPTGNLDPKNKRAILDILLQYVKDNEATLLVATHDYDLLDFFDEVIDFKKLNLT